MNKKNITNDTIIDNLIYFLVKNIKTILSISWIIISLFVGFSIGYFIANNEEHFTEIFFFAGIVISTIFACFTSIINESRYISYNNQLSKHIQDKYNG
ncbi:hypothetical protein M0Q50_02475 [bacterium]|jgi:hypothetical protein|nr:hypothetical protein [bacterium]